MKEIAIDILEIWMKDALKSNDLERLQRMQIYWQILRNAQRGAN